MKITHTEFLVAVGIEVKVSRIRKKLTTKELADLTGLSTYTIAAIENGKFDSKILCYKRIADSLEIDIKNFF